MFFTTFRPFKPQMKHWLDFLQWFTTCRVVKCSSISKKKKKKRIMTGNVISKFWTLWRVTALFKWKDESGRTQWKKKPLRLKVEGTCYCTANMHFQFPYCSTTSLSALHGLYKASKANERWKHGTVLMNENVNITRHKIMNNFEHIE